MMDELTTWIRCGCQKDIGGIWWGFFVFLLNSDFCIMLLLSLFRFNA